MSDADRRRGVESEFKIRALAPGCGLALLTLFTGLWLFDRGAYFGLMDLWGAPALPDPFADWGAVVGLMHCAHRGVNVYVANQCGTFSYSPLWFWARLIPMESAWRNGVGLAIDAAFFTSLWFVLRPRTWGAATLLALISISPMVVYGAERANADLILFVLIAAAGVLAVGGWARRTGAYALLLLAGLLKFYPLVGLIIVLRERPKAFAVIAIASTLILVAVVVAFGHQLAAALAAAPSERWTVDGVAARNLWQGLQVLAPSKTLALAATWIVIAGAGLIALRLADRPDLSHAIAHIDAPERTLLVLGAAIVVGFYVAGQPLAYHGVYLLPVEAGLIGLRREAGPALRRALGWAAAGLLALMWEPACRTLVVALGPRIWVAYWLARELVGWGVIATLAAILVRFAMDDGVIAALRRSRTDAVTATEAGA